jgi:hypothetical protein
LVHFENKNSRSVIFLVRLYNQLYPPDNECHQNLAEKFSRNPLKILRVCLLNLASIFNLFECISTIFGEEQKKIIEKHLADSEVFSAKSIFLSEEKTFLEKLFVTLKLSI